MRGRGRKDSPSHPRSVRRIPQSLRQRSIRSSVTPIVRRPTRRRESASMIIDSIDSRSIGSTATSISANAWHAHPAVRASRISAPTRSIVRWVTDARNSEGWATAATSCASQPASAKRNARASWTIARPSAPSARRVRRRYKSSNRPTHTRASRRASLRSAHNARASTDADVLSFPARSSRATARRSPGVAPGFSGGRGSASSI